MTGSMWSVVRICALVCFASFGWGMARHFRREGPTSGALVVSGVLALISAVAHVTALFTMPLKYPAAAMTLYVLSCALFWWAAAVTRGKLAACWQRPISPAVVREGPYRLIRHPFYLAYDLTWVAGVVATGWWPLAFTVLIMATVYEAAARQEERSLALGPLAMQYASYKPTAGRYWPRWSGSD
jgi:protein-S-isoprenylcysteine O-methyltransferase Ste14